MRSGGSDYENLMSVVHEVQDYRRSSVRKFVLLFIVSLAQIIFGGIFLQGLVVREIAHSY